MSDDERQVPARSMRLALIAARDVLHWVEEFISNLIFRLAKRLSSEIFHQH
jgi:hypothetical protein